jgi:hypothetical protein
MALVPAKIIMEDGKLFYFKCCMVPRVQKALVSTEPAYYKLCHDCLKPGHKPLQFQTGTDLGCPHDCGPCTDYE